MHIRVNLDLPTVEVRVEDLHIETEVYAETDRQLPSLLNAMRSGLEVRPFSIQSSVQLAILLLVPSSRSR